MFKPDFAKYSEEQLRQILNTIDAARFPERVQEIHARLAQLAFELATLIEPDAPKLPEAPPAIAGFWRRLGAFIIDAIVLGLVGLFLGLFLQEQFEAMGAWGRLLGFIIALVYFSVMESSIVQGCTLGKLALNIKVVTSAGVPLSFSKALLRSAVFCVPYFLNNAPLGDGSPNLALTAIQSFLLFGLGGAIVYLSIFNRRTRQSLHDLLVGAVVVRDRATRIAPQVLPVWRGHFVTVAALFLVSLGLIAFSYSMLGSGAIKPLMLVQQQILHMPGVRQAGVFEGSSFASGAKHKTFLTISAFTIADAPDEKALAISIAGIAIKAYPQAQQLDRLSVTLIQGYDIGIASKWRSRSFNASPDAWRDGRVEN